MTIIAVTSCPVGAAHTYMAATALEKAAKKTGHSVKVETQGGLGIKNRIGPGDVEAADVLILATDIACLEAERFVDIPTLEVSTKECIKDSPSVIARALELLQD